MGSMNPMSQSLHHFLLGSTLVIPLSTSSSHLLSHGFCYLPPLRHPPFFLFFTSSSTPISSSHLFFYSF